MGYPIGVALRWGVGVRVGLRAGALRKSDNEAWPGNRGGGHRGRGQGTVEEATGSKEVKEGRMGI